jgi:hypothetical protein
MLFRVVQRPCSLRGSSSAVLRMRCWLISTQRVQWYSREVNPGNAEKCELFVDRDEMFQLRARRADFPCSSSVGRILSRGMAIQQELHSGW